MAQSKEYGDLGFHYTNVMFLHAIGCLSLEKIQRRGIECLGNEPVVYLWQQLNPMKQLASLFLTLTLTATAQINYPFNPEKTPTPSSALI